MWSHIIYDLEDYYHKNAGYVQWRYDWQQNIGVFYFWRHYMYDEKFGLKTDNFLFIIADVSESR